MWRFSLCSFSQQNSGETRQQFFSDQLWQQYSGELRHQFSIFFCSNILVSFGSNSLWEALVATFLVRFGNHFSGRL